MTIRELIKETEGTYQRYLRAGLISPTHNFYKQIFDLVKSDLEQGKEKMDVYINIAETVNVHEQTVMTGCRFMSREFREQ